MPLSGETVYDLVADSTLPAVDKPSTPPPSGPPRTASFQQTPWTFNTGSFADTSDLRRIVGSIFKDEVEDNLRIDHPDVLQSMAVYLPIRIGQVQEHMALFNLTARSSLPACNGTFGKSMGLPCAHIIKERLWEGMSLTVDDFNAHRNIKRGDFTGRLQTATSARSK